VRYLPVGIARLAICCGLLLACMSRGATPGQARPSSLAAREGLAAHSFYAIAADTYHTWCHGALDDRCPSPARVARFAAQVQYVGFYFETNYPTQHAGDMDQVVLPRFGLAIHASNGSLYTRYASFADNTQIGFQESRAYYSTALALIHAPQIRRDINGSVYPDDTYRADLSIDGKVAAHTTFIVGSGRPAHTAQVHPTIQAFYPATESDYNTWTDFGTVPKKVNTVKGGAQVFFYLSWSNTPTYLPLTLGILDSRQHTLVAHTGVFTLPRPSGYAMHIVVTPDRSPFVPGIYQGEVLTGDQVLATVSFAIASL